MTNIVLIPAYKPDQRLISLCNELSKIEYLNLLVINNGNNDEYLNYFDSISSLNRVSILHLNKNQGKGFGIKKGLEHIYLNHKKTTNIIFADADGQHIVDDICKLAIYMQASEEKNLLHIGNRQHNNRTPFKNFMANKVFNYFFKKRNKIKINDALCGLRAIKVDDIALCTSLKYNDFRFEVEMILAFQVNNRKISEENIKSIYFKGTKSTLFITDVIRLLQILFYTIVL